MAKASKMTDIMANVNNMAMFNNEDESNNIGIKLGETKLDNSHKLVDVNLLDEAPEEWNKFPKMSEEKRAETKISIYNNGIFTPLSVWEKEDGRYMIIAGHNRASIVKEIISEESTFNKYVPCRIYGITEIDEAKAKEIIIDTNYLQRDDLPQPLRLEIINDRISYAIKQKTPMGETIEVLSEKLGLKKTAIYEDIQIGKNLTEELKNYYFSGRIKKSAAITLSKLEKDIQLWLVKEYSNEINNGLAPLLKKDNLTKAKIIKIIEGRYKTPEIIIKDIRVPIPAEHVEEFKILVAKFKKEKGIK